LGRRRRPHQERRLRHHHRPLDSCHFGLATTGGAPGVGRAVNATVVASRRGIFVLDYFVSFILD
jgi:hypothetical protein